jgi:hypothetical protein
MLQLVGWVGFYWRYFISYIHPLFFLVVPKEFYALDEKDKRRTTTRSFDHHLISSILGKK